MPARGELFHPCPCFDRVPIRGVGISNFLGGQQVSQAVINKSYKL